MKLPNKPGLYWVRLNSEWRNAIERFPEDDYGGIVRIVERDGFYYPSALFVVGSGTSGGYHLVEYVGSILDRIHEFGERIEQPLARE